MAIFLDSFYLVLKKSLEQGHGTLLSRQENIALLTCKGHQKEDHKSRRERRPPGLCMSPFSLGRLVNTIRETEHSVLVDLSSCHAANEYGVVLKDGSPNLAQSALSDLAIGMEKFEPVRVGDMLLIGSTACYRTDDIFIRTNEGSTYYMTTDDSYVMVGLVPGEQAAVIKVVVISDIPNPDKSIVEEFPLTHLVANIKYYMLPLTDPISYDIYNLDWHALLVAFSASLTFRTLARAVRNGRLTMKSIHDVVMVELEIKAGRISSSSVNVGQGIMHIFASLLVGRKSGSIRADRITKLLIELEGDWRPIKIALVVCQVAEEVLVSGKVDLTGLKHSRIVEEFIPDVAVRDVEKAIRSLAGDDFGALLHCESSEIVLGDECFDLQMSTSLESADEW